MTEKTYHHCTREERNARQRWWDDTMAALRDDLRISNTASRVGQVILSFIWPGADKPEGEWNYYRPTMERIANGLPSFTKEGVKEPSRETIRKAKDELRGAGYFKTRSIVGRFNLEYAWITNRGQIEIVQQMQAVREAELEQRIANRREVEFEKSVPPKKDVGQILAQIPQNIAPDSSQYVGTKPIKEAPQKKYTKFSIADSSQESAQG